MKTIYENLGKHDFGFKTNPREAMGDDEDYDDDEDSDEEGEEGDDDDDD